MKNFKSKIVKTLFNDTLPDYIKKLNDEKLLELEANYHKHKKNVLKTKKPNHQTIKLINQIQTLIDEEKTKRGIEQSDT